MEATKIWDNIDANSVEGEFLKDFFELREKVFMCAIRAAHPRLRFPLTEKKIKRYKFARVVTHTGEEYLTENNIIISSAVINPSTALGNYFVNRCLSR